MSLHVALVAVLVGLASGAVSGVLGVGGGVLMVPGMVLLLAESQHVAEGTSLLVIVPTALVGAATHWRNRYVLLVPALLLGAGGVVGALAGSRLALSVPGRTLRIVFVAYLIVVGLRMAWPPRRATGSPQA
jgi:uncharacterized membrane protein YfcA